MEFRSFRESKLYKFITYIVVSQFILPPAVINNVYAEIITDPNASVAFKPVINQVNNVPVVNITAPNTSGISHNKYQDFDVDEEGVVFNNALVGGNSRLAGYLAANPLLGGQTASTILNEVTGLSDSQLKGLAEVHGDQANVIIANPNGITCNGCGFINTERATFTTGIPSFTNGSLHFNIDQGEVSFEGEGYHYLSYVGQLDVLSRYMSIDSQISTKDQLNLISGLYTFDYSKSLDSEASVEDWVTRKKTNSNDRPDRVIAIDASIFGAMQSGKINIMATEQGTGVKADGYLFSQVDDLFIQSAGDVSLNNADSVSKVDINARGDVSITSDMIANEAIEINASNITTSTATDMVAGEISLSADQKIDLHGDVQSLTLSLSSQDLENSADLMAIERIDLLTENHAQLTDSDITTGTADWSTGSNKIENVNLNIRLFNLNSGDTYWKNALIESDSADVNVAGFTLEGVTLLTDSTSILSSHWNSTNSKLNTNNLTIKADSLSSIADTWTFYNGSISAKNSLSLTDSQMIGYNADLNGSSILTDSTKILLEQLTINAEEEFSSKNDEWKILQFDESSEPDDASFLSINSEKSTFNSSEILAQSLSESSEKANYLDTTVQAVNFSTNTNHITSDSYTSWIVGEKLNISTNQADLAGSVLSTSVNIKADQAKLSGAWSAYENIDLLLTESLKADGLLLTTNNLTTTSLDAYFKDSEIKSNQLLANFSGETNLDNSVIEAALLDLSGNALNSDQDSSIAASTMTLDLSTINNEGELFALEALDVTGLDIVNDGKIVSYGRIQLDNNTISNNGDIAALSSILVSSNDVTNIGSIAANTTLNIESDRLTNLGNLSALEKVSISSEDVLKNDGSILSNDQSLSSTLIENSGIINADTLSIEYLNLKNSKEAEIASNQGTYIAKSDQAVLDNLGSLIFRDAINWVANGSDAGDLNNSGSIKGSNLHFSLLDSVANNGSIFAIGSTEGEKGTLNIGDETFDQNGTIIADILQIDRDDFQNNGTIQAENLNINLTGQLTNNHEIFADNSFIDASDLVTLKDSVLSSEILSIGTDRLDNGGTLVGSDVQIAGKDRLTSSFINREEGSIVQRTSKDESLNSNQLKIWDFSDFTNEGVIEADNQISILNVKSLKNDESDLTDLDNAARIVSDSGILLKEIEFMQNNSVLVADALRVETSQLFNNGVIGAGEAVIDVQGSGLFGRFYNNGRIYQSNLQASDDTRLTLDTQSGHFSISANELRNNENGSIELGNADITLRYGYLTNHGLIHENNDLSGSLDIHGLKDLTNYGDIQVNSDLDIVNGRIRNLGQDSFIRAASIGGDNLTAFENEGVFSAEGSINLDTSDFRNTKNSKILANSIDLVTNSDFTNHGEIGAKLNVNVIGKSIVNAALAEMYSQNGTLSLSASNSITNNGKLISGNDISLESKSINNTNHISADDWLKINQSTTGSLTNSGTIYGENFKFGSSGKKQSALTNNGQLSGGNLDIYANTISNNSNYSNIDAKSSLEAYSTTFTNKGNVRSNGLLSLNQKTLNNHSGAEISSKGDLTFSGISSTDTLSNSGKIVSGGRTNINMETISNYGNISGENGGQWDFASFTNHANGKVSIKGNLKMGNAGHINLRVGQINNYGKLYAGSFDVYSVGRLYNAENAQWVAFEGDLNYTSSYRNNSKNGFENAGSIFAKGAFDIDLQDDFYNHGTLESFSVSGNNRIAVNGGNIFNGMRDTSIGTIRVAGDLELSATSFINASKGTGTFDNYTDVIDYRYTNSGCINCKSESARFYYQMDLVKGTYEHRVGSTLQVGGTLTGKGGAWSNESSTISADHIDVAGLNSLDNKTVGFAGTVDTIQFYKKFGSRGSKRSADSLGLRYIGKEDQIEGELSPSGDSYTWVGTGGTVATILSSDNYTLTDAAGINVAVINARTFNAGNTNINNQGSFTAGTISNKVRDGAQNVSSASASGDSGDPTHTNNERGSFSNGADENTIRIANRKPTATISLLSFIIPGLSFDALNAASVQGDKTPEELAAQAELQKQLDKLGQSNSANSKKLNKGQTESFNKQGPSLFDLDPEILQMIVADTEYELTQDYIFDKIDPDRVVDDEPQFFLDPYEEAQAITQAALQQTGEAFFSPDWNSSAEQRQGLYDNAIDYLNKNQNVKIGEALSDDQIAALNQPIIWYVTMNINGEDQLVPTVYLPEANLEQFENTRTGTLVAENMDIDVKDFTNTGDMKITGDANISADTFTNERHVYEFGNDKNFGVLAGDGGNINAGNLSITSRNDINNIGASINTTGVLRMDAAGDINLTAVEMSSRSETKDNISESTNYLLSQIKAEGNAEFNAGGNFLAEAVQGDFLSDLIINADSIDFVGIAEREYSKTSSSKKDRFSKTKKTTEKENINFIGSAFKVAGNFTLDAENDIYLEGSTIDVEGTADVDAGGNFTMVAGISQESESMSKSTKGVATQSAQQKGYVKQTAVKSGITSGGDMTIEAGGDITLVGSDLSVGQTQSDDGNVVGLGECEITGKCADRPVLTIGRDTIARDENGQILKDENGNFITTEGGTANVTFTTQELRNEEWNEKSSGLSGAFGKLANGLMAVAGVFGIKTEIEIGKSTTERTETVTQVSSDVAATNLVIMADEDVSVIGSNVNVDGHAVVSAENVIIDAAQESHTESRSETTETASSSGPSMGEDEVTIASISNTRHTETETTTSTTWKGSTFNAGSLEMNADTIALISSTVDVDGDADIKTDNMVVGGRQNTTETTKTTETKTTTIGVGVRNAYVDTVRAAQAADQAAVAVEDAKEAYEDAQRKVKNGELPAEDLKYYEANIAAATANLAQATIALASAGANAAANTQTGGFTASASASTSYSSSSETNTTNTFIGSGIKVGGNATIDAGKSFDMEGSSLEVEGALALNADTITVRAGQNTTSSSSSSEDHSTSATMGSSGDASGSMSTSKTNSDSSSTTHVNSLISAGSFTSESEELTLSGANLTAGTVDITTDTLLVESLQDTSTSSSESSGGNLGLSSNGMPSSYGANASKDNANSEWVNTQTGIIGGDVTIKAKDTTVTGAVIAAVDIDENGNQTDNGNLAIETDTLTVNDIFDNDESSSKGVNVSTGSSSTTVGANYSGHDKEQTTKATLGNGSVIVGGKDISEHEALADVNRDINNSQEITKDQERGGLDANVTVDHRLVTEEGRQDIAQDIQDTAELAGKVGETAVNTATFVVEEFNRDELSAAAQSENSELMGELLIQQLEAANPDANFTDEQRQELVQMLGGKYSDQYDELTSLSEMNTHDDAMSTIVEGMVQDLNTLNSAMNGISEDGYKEVGGLSKSGQQLGNILLGIAGVPPSGNGGNNSDWVQAEQDAMNMDSFDGSYLGSSTETESEQPGTDTPHVGGSEIAEIDNSPYTTPSDDEIIDSILENLPPKVGDNSTATPIQDDLGLGLVLSRPENLSPDGAGRSGAFKEAKRRSGIPVSQQPVSVESNVDRRGNTQPGKVYVYEVPAEGGGTKLIRIRDDAEGHDYGEGNDQNRGPHFNDENDGHYDY